MTAAGEHHPTPVQQQTQAGADALRISMYNVESSKENCETINIPMPPTTEGNESSSHPSVGEEHWNNSNTQQMGKSDQLMTARIEHEHDVAVV